MEFFRKELWLSIKICIIIALNFLVINFILNGAFIWDQFKYNCLYSFYYGLPLSFVNGAYFRGLDNIIPWDKSPKMRVFVGVTGAIVLTMLTLFLLNYFLWVQFWGKEFSFLFSEQLIIFYLIGLAITVLISAILYAISFFKEVQEQVLITEKLRKEKLQTELNALKAHIDPHFLFNSFNVLSGQIDEDPKKAQKLLGQISSVYRYILENRNENTNTIKEELNFAEKYLNIQQTRFEDSIELHVDLREETLVKKIPSLSLQLLLENAIKHNGFNEEEPLRISIAQENNNLVIKNNLKPRRNLVESNGLGLQNIQDRYGLLNESDFSFEDDGQSFIVKLPLLS